MRGFGYALSAVVLGIWLICFPTESPGWELDMSGSMRWAYEWYQQRGSNGFFGPYDVDKGANTTTANLNFWNGGQFDTNITTGADAGWSYFSVILDPTVKMNDAIRLKARLRLGEYGNIHASNYITQESPGVSNAFSEGQWTLFWATCRTPWGTFGVGKRPWQFGNGFQYDGSDALTTESMVLAVPYGPLDFGFGFYPYRYAGLQGILPEDPVDLQIGRYFSRADRNGSFTKDLLAFLTYNNGSMYAGILGVYGSYHIGPEAPLGANQRVGQDSEYFHGTAFLRFINGFYFYNAEIAWLYWTDRYSDPLGRLGLPNPRYVQQVRMMSEQGIYAGPIKASLLQAWMPGPDRRNGALIDRQSAAFVWHPTLESYLGSFNVFRPYSYIFSYDYGSGLNGYNLSRDGFVRDALVVALRIDYAVAANLNVYGSFCYARRTSDGYGWGCIAPNDTFFDGIANDGNLRFNVNGVPGSPNIPEKALGYEIDTGFEWKLLEGWSANVVLGYWQPGPWFSYACIDRSVPNWNLPGASNFGTRPYKTIDPVIGGEFSFNFQF
jgi:hypothetical protein